ncbi:YdeI/OmpD-associated family protein [Sphingobacterium faecium]|uniref:YdeI/OmpD-associated family protein n=1 Tax=Sphingobacterium faecium TaxID=34087 RepID=UPI002468C5D8|nr:YdeI/OmpD-associated family protein [Sphingobacterium faecium]MDH5826329.1 YdeI/OmpD-associated family protein [Sphingobacterium faecium]
MNTAAAEFFQKAKKWNEEFLLLRDIIRENPSLVEDYKWMHPCYTYEGKNVVLIHGFKDYCALLFHKGALLKDSEHILIQQTDNVQSARQIRFTHIEEILALKTIIQEYIKEAIEIEKSGKKIELKKVSDYPLPEEFQQALEQDQELHTAFYALTPGRQKGYLFYFNQAKQSKTRQNRIEKYYQQILDGKGIDEKS